MPYLLASVGMTFGRVTSMACLQSDGAGREFSGSDVAGLTAVAVIMIAATVASMSAETVVEGVVVSWLPKSRSTAAKRRARSVELLKELDKHPV